MEEGSEQGMSQVCYKRKRKDLWWNGMGWDAKYLSSVIEREIVAIIITIHCCISGTTVILADGVEGTGGQLPQLVKQFLVGQSRQGGVHHTHDVCMALDITAAKTRVFR